MNLVLKINFQICKFEMTGRKKQICFLELEAEIHKTNKFTSRTITNHLPFAFVDKKNVFHFHFVLTRSESVCGEWLSKIETNFKLKCILNSN